jgi:5-methyltetrahydrofolate--homocysteine methyltransferase
MSRSDRLTALEEAGRSRVLVMDGAMGTAIQSRKLGEADYRGWQLAYWSTPLKGDNDLLSLTKPRAIREIHEEYLAAGADIIETNSFNATAISQEDYGLEVYAPAMARWAAEIARRAADEWSERTPQKPRFVAGAIGPLNKTLSISPKVEDPGFRAVSWDQVLTAYREQVDAMIDLVDFFLIETVFDTLNAKAAIAAVLDARKARGLPAPIMISGTITDASGRTLSGQTAEAFWNSVRHARPWAIGLNCALGAEQLRPHVATLARVADTRVLAYPNAGLPNAFGEYDETPETTAGHLGAWARDGVVNILGGCCGTTPEHIRAIAAAVEGVKPRAVPDIARALRLSGLEPFTTAS